MKFEIQFNSKLLQTSAFILSMLFFVSFSFGQATDIATARSKDTLTVVTIKGIATNGAELGTIRYLQDNTGAIPAFYTVAGQPTFATVKRGDSVQVTGKLKSFNSLLEIDPLQSFTIINNGNNSPTPLIITPNGMNESNEAQLVQMDNVVFNNGGQTFAGSTNYTITSNGQTGTVRVNTLSNLVGKLIPTGAVRIYGLVSQFSPATAPLAGYQLLLRDDKDVVQLGSIFITIAPEQKNITKTSFDINWTANTTGTGWINYGTSPTSMNTKVNATVATNTFSTSLTGLTPATFYYLRAYVNKIVMVSTVSNSNGFIDVYFNHKTAGGFSNGVYPKSQTGLQIESRITQLIDAATTSIDVAAYNCNRPQFITALKNAAARGVVVRYVTDVDEANLALVPPLNFKVNRGNPNGLMHDKFIVIDRDNVQKCWVEMGSMNFTSNNIEDDFNNVVMIQDQSLARAYTEEFEEMWGTKTADPGIFGAKFGSNKVDNTPHKFVIGGIALESYFSPSDGTTSEIVSRLATADKDVQIAMLTFTMDPLRDAVIAAKNRGAVCRALIDNINDTGSDFNALNTGGVMAKQYVSTTQFHHKYCIIDGSPAGVNSDPMVITGSHNWSNSAQTSNDENTIIFHNKDIANLFIQEFEGRWCETVGGTCVLADENIANGIDVKLAPNPANDFLLLKIGEQIKSNISITIVDNLGRRLMTRFADSATNTIEIPTNNLENGQYYLIVNGDAKSSTLKFIVQH
jgi:phosphatidylserine/phosphatidylglycerophosphate/cardiolipin synthase-like enzyme